MYTSLFSSFFVLNLKIPIYMDGIVGMTDWIKVYRDKLKSVSWESEYWIICLSISKEKESLAQSRSISLFTLTQDLFITECTLKARWTVLPGAYSTDFHKHKELMFESKEIHILLYFCHRK